ncbi:hypothetical protein F4805DRAFT_470139 [Annulohypoxylon moriforme]|nr:hypothetical protein F4805DRAFT_470139 [Annulohypoxylon moriforme]
MDCPTAPDFYNTWNVEKDRLITKHESDLALQDELLEKLEQDLRQINDDSLQKLKGAVPSTLYRDIIVPMAEKSLKHDQREIRASHDNRVKIIVEKHVEALKHHKMLYQDKLTVAPVNKNEPAAKPERRLIMRIQSRKRKASTSEEIHPKRLRVDSSVNQTRTPALTPANEPAKPHSHKQTITFDEVYQGGTAKHKDIIVEWPANSRQWYILKCEQHGLRFTRNSVQGAAKHLNGNGHGCTNRNRDHAVRTLGYLVTDCDENLAKLNNQVAEEAYANGYKPPFPRSKKQRDPSKVSKKKHVRGLGISDGPSVSHTANLVPGSARGISSTPNEAITGKSLDSWDGITHPKVFHIYYGRWKDDSLGKKAHQIYPVMILGWDSQNGSGLKDSDLNATGLLKKKAKPPNCYTYDSRKITGWAPGYEDGGPKVKFRKFPVMFFDESQTVGWFPARDLMKFPLNQRKVSAQSDHPFNAARRWIAEREGYKTWEDREKARTGVDTPSASPLTPAESANTASHTDFTEDSHDSNDSDPESEGTSVHSASTEKMMRELREKGGEITGDEDYAASDPDPVSDVDDSLDCEIDDWIRSPPSTAKPDTAKGRPWAFYSLRSTENRDEPKPQDHAAGNHLTPRQAIYNSSTVPENQGSINQTLGNELLGTTSKSIENTPVQLQICERRSPRPTPNIVTQVSETSSFTDSTGGGLVPNDNCSSSAPYGTKLAAQEEVPSTRAESQVVGNMESLVMEERATIQTGETVQRNLEEASHAKEFEKGVLHKVVMGSSSIQPLANVENAAPGMELVGGVAVPEPQSADADADADFELSFYRSGNVSWERSKEQEECVRLFYSVDRRTVSTRQGPVAIMINPMEMLGFSREKDIIPGSRGNTGFLLKHKNGSLSRLVFDRNRGSRLGNGMLQVRGFIKWLRLVKPDIPLLLIETGVRLVDRKVKDAYEWEGTEGRGLF